MFSFKAKDRWERPNLKIVIVAVILSYLYYSGIAENKFTLSLGTFFAISPTPNAIRISLFFGISCLFLGTAMSHFKNKKRATYAKNTGLALLSSALGCIGGWLIAAISVLDSFALIIASLFLYIFLITLYWVIPNLYHQFVMRYVQENTKGNSFVIFSTIAVTTVAMIDLSKQVVI